MSWINDIENAAVDIIFPPALLIQLGASEAGKAVGSFLGDIAGKIASGLDVGIVTVMTDLFKPFVGALEIGLGVIVAVIAFFILFGNQMLSLASAVAPAAAAAL